MIVKCLNKYQYQLILHHPPFGVRAGVAGPFCSPEGVQHGLLGMYYYQAYHYYYYYYYYHC